MTAVAVRPEESPSAEPTARPALVPQRNGGALFAGGVIGNVGGRGGSKPAEFVRACREAVTDNQLLRVLVRIAIGDIHERIDTAKDGTPIYGETKNSDRIRAIELLVNRGFGLPTQAVEVTGAVLTGPITEQERRARIRELLLNALERIEPADVIEAKP